MRSFISVRSHSDILSLTPSLGIQLLRVRTWSSEGEPMTHRSKVTCHNVLDDISLFTNTKLLLKACPILTWFSRPAEAMQEWDILSAGIWTQWKLCERLGLQTLQKSHKSRVYFHTVFRGRTVQKGAFSKAALRRKALCDPEQLQVGCKGLSAEKEHCLKVSSIWQILKNAGLQGELRNCPRFTCLGE